MDEDLRQLLRYDPETGELFWRRRNVSMFAFDPEKHTQTRIYSPDRACNLWNTRYADKPAFNALNNWGYLHGKLGKHYYLAHRIVWKIMTGDFPLRQLDHINGKKTDNRWCNLREATPSENTQNRAIPINNKSGSIGIFWNTARKKWQGQIRLEGKQIFLGLFDTKAEALIARRAAEKALEFVSRDAKEDEEQLEQPISARPLP